MNMNKEGKNIQVDMMQHNVRLSRSIIILVSVHHHGVSHAHHFSNCICHQAYKFLDL